MKICLLTDDYLPNSMKVGAKMMHELACEFLKQGHTVTVIAPSSELKSKFEISQLDGVTVCCFKSGKIKNVNKVRRVINEKLLSIHAWNSFQSYFKQNKHDIVIYYSPTIFWGRLVRRLKKLWNVPSYLILRDIFPQWAIDAGLIRSGSTIEKYFGYFEKKNYEAANIIGLMSPKNLEWFDKNVKCSSITEVLYNWASNVPVSITTSSYKRSLGIEGKIVFFYGGNIGHAQDMMNIVRLAINMQNEERAHFVIVGSGDEVELVVKAVEEYKLINLSLLPSVSQNEFKQMLAEFDIGLFSLHKNHKTHNFPGKLLGYMVQGKPILGSVNQDNDLKNIIEESGAGLVTINGEDDIFTANAKKLLNDEHYRNQIGENSKKLISSTFSVEATAKQILHGLGKINLKKILFLTDNFPPEVNAPATRTFEHCKEWVKQGADVTVITCAPNFPQGRVYKGYKNKLIHKEIIDGIKVIRVWSYIVRNKGFTKRILDYISFSISSFIVGLFLRTDVIIATSPQFFTAISGRALSFWKGTPWIMEVRDLWPEAIKSVGLLKNNLIFKYLEWQEISCYNSASIIIVVTNSFKKEIVKKGISASKIRVVTNGVNLALFKPHEKDKALLNKMNLEGKLILGYIGTIGLAHKLDFIMDCAKKLKHTNIHFLFIGSGSEKENLEHKKQIENIANVTILETIPKDKLIKYLSLIDIALINLKKERLFKTVIPSKIFENAAMKIPILLGVDGEAREIVENFNAGLYFEPENERDFICKLQQLIDNKKNINGGPVLAVAYERNKLARKMLSILIDVK